MLHLAGLNPNPDAVHCSSGTGGASGVTGAAGGGDGAAVGGDITTGRVEKNGVGVPNAGGDTPLHPDEQFELEHDGLHCGEKLQLVSLLQLPQSNVRVPPEGGGVVPPSLGAGG